jgi:hypothetical protein
MANPCRKGDGQKPCNNYAAGRKFVQGQCRICWLYNTDSRYRALWDGLELTRIDPRDLRKVPCLYLRDTILEKPTNCPKCWVRACDLHDSCTTTEQRTGHKCCQTCEDYDPSY